MKIAVYTIAKNEEKFVDRWVQSAKDADYIYVVDTGSTDSTVRKLVDYKCDKNYNLFLDVVTLKPFRFDDARNLSLNMLPKDIDLCICLDMDEVLVEGWRNIIEKNWQKGYHRLRYNYIWSWSNNKPALTYHADKIHTRFGFRWVNPVHEILKLDHRLGEEKQHFISETLIHHFPDNTKSRLNYLDLLALAIHENPLDDRCAHYYARELMYSEQYEKAITEFNRHIHLPTSLWDDERSASYRYMGDCYWALQDFDNAVLCFKHAQDAAPHLREPKISLAQAYKFIGDWKSVEYFCKQALAITNKSNSYINSESAWSSWPKQMLQEAQVNLTLNQKE